MPNWRMKDEHQINQKYINNMGLVIEWSKYIGYERLFEINKKCIQNCCLDSNKEQKLIIKKEYGYKT